MSATTKTRSLQAALAAAFLVHGGSAAAVEFQIGESTVRVENLFTIGASFRMQDVDPSLVGKSTLYKIDNPGANDPATGSALCLHRTSGTADGGASSNLNPAAQGPNQYEAGVVFDACATSDAVSNQNFVNRPGSYSPNGDNGNLNFDKGDLVHAVAKLTTDFNTSLFDFNIFVRGVAFFDANYSDFEEVHNDTTMQAGRSELPRRVERIVGVDYDILDYNIGRTFTIGARDVAVKVGGQVLNWGESSLLALNSLNTINPPDARRLAIPGLDLKEAFRPIGMVTLGTDIIESLSAEVFYTYDWKPLLVDPVGSYFSQSDTLGDGGDYAMLSFGKAPEDPGFVIANPTAQEQISYPTGRRGYYRPIDTCGFTPDANHPTGCIDTIGALGSTASRTVFRDHAEEERREPDGGDYGISLKMFLEEVNNGTEVAFYHATYDSRLPVVSAFAALDSCLPDNGVAATAVSDCGIAVPLGTPAASEAIPVDTARLIVEYPEDIRLWGVSFNTTVGDYAVSGEYAFRENLPIQIDTADLTYTALQPAFPAQDVAVDVDGVGPLPGVTIPGRRSAFPAFLTGYRGYACSPTATDDTDCIQPGQYVQGYERFKVGQANLTVLRLIGGDNPIGASQMTLLLEMGMQQVFNMPSLSELQLEGTGSDTHISGGADGTTGIEPAGAGSPANTLRQNPTANKDYLGYGTSESYGYRFINLNRWESALFDMINVETLAIVRHDVKGTSPGIGTNFSDGRKQFNFGLRGDYLSTYVAEIRYTWYTGGGKHDGQRDRDNIFVTLGYQF